MWIWYEPSVELVVIWCGSVVDLVWIWCGSGVALVWILSEPGVELVWIWCGSGVDLVWIWFGSGVDLVWGSIIVRHMKSISVPSLPFIVYGPIRSMHNASHGVIITIFVGSFPYFGG